MWKWFYIATQVVLLLFDIKLVKIADPFLSPRARCVIFWETTKNIRVTSKNMQAFLALADVSVHESMFRQTLNKNSMYLVKARRKPLISRKTTWMNCKSTKRMFSVQMSQVQIV